MTGRLREACLKIWKHRWSAAVWLIFANQVVILLSGIAAGTYVLFALIAAACVLDPESGSRRGLAMPTGAHAASNQYLLLFLCMPNKYVQVLGLLVFALKATIPNFRRCAKSFLSWQVPAFFAFAFAAGIVNCIRFGGDFVGLAVQLAVYGLLFATIRNAGDSAGTPVPMRFFAQLTLAEVALGLLQWLCMGEAGDRITGSLISAHWYAVFLIACAYYVVGILRMEPRFRKGIVVGAVVAATAFMVVLADAKHVCLCFLAALAMNFLLGLLKIRKKVLVSWMLIALAVVAAVLLAGTPLFARIVDGNRTLETYVRDDAYNKKFTFFDRTFRSMLSPDGLIGYGPGQYGSQVCISRAKGIIFDWNPALAGYASAIAPYREAISGLMTEDYTMRGIEYSSMSLGYPLVSFVPFIAELGLIGFALFLLAMERQLGGYRDATLLIMFFLCTLFDTYFEIPCVTCSLVLMHCLLNASPRLREAARG